MRVAVLYASRDVRFEERPDPTIIEPTDAIIRISATCVCGSDLWDFRGINPVTQPTTMGHEYCGIVEEVGPEVTSIKRGQFVIGSLYASDNACPNCQAGYQTSCLHRVYIGDCQGELVRVPLADGILVATPGQSTDKLIPSVLALSDVMGTGWFGAVAAGVQPGMTVEELTGGIGADAVLECVGTAESMSQGIRSTRPGGGVGFVGVPHGVEVSGTEPFYSHVRLRGGPAPVRRFLPQLIDLVWNGTIDRGKVFDLALPLDQVSEGYQAMDERRAIKALLWP